MTNRSSMIVSSPEDRFIKWMMVHTTVADTLLHQLPVGAFSPSGWSTVQKLRQGISVTNDAVAFTDHEATDFLQAQLLSVLGRDVAKAQKSKNFDALRTSFDLLEACQSVLDPPPLE